LTLVGLSCWGVSGFFGYRFWSVTKGKRAVNSAVPITSTSDLSTKDGEYIVFEGKVQSDNPFQSLYVLDNEGKQLLAPIYLLEEYKWTEVYEETKMTNNALNNQLGKYFRKKEFVSKEQLLKKISVYRDFSVSSKKRGTVVPMKVKKALKDFPLLEQNHVYTPPPVLSTKGFLLARIYDTGLESTEKYLSLGTKVTVIGKLKNKDGTSYVVPDDDKPYIVTNVSYKDVRKSFQIQGAPELGLTITSFVVGVALIAFGSSESRRNRN